MDESARPGRIIWMLAWPAVIEQVLVTLVQYVDTAMVGSLGAAATAAIALVTSTIWVINGIFFATGVGFGVLVGRSIGANDREYTVKVMRQAVFSIFAVGAAISVIMLLIAQRLPAWFNADPAIRQNAADYFAIVGTASIFNLCVAVCSNILRCSGDTKTPLLFNTLTNLINVALNFLLIFPARTIDVFGQPLRLWGAGLGVPGAALATALATAFSGVMLLRALYKKAPVRITPGSYRPDAAILKQAALLGSPVAFERLTLSFGQIAMTAIVTSLGTVALASHHMAITAEAMAYMPLFGISATATTLVAQSLGAKKAALAKRYADKCMLYGFVFMVIIGVVMYFTAEPLIALFTPDKQVIALGGLLFKIEAFGEPLCALFSVAFGVFRGAGDTKWPFITCAISMWAVRLPLAYAIVRFTSLGLAGAWLAVVIDLTVRGIIAFARYRGGKWITAWERPSAA